MVPITRIQVLCHPWCWVRKDRSDGALGFHFIVFAPLVYSPDDNHNKMNALPVVWNTPLVGMSNVSLCEFRIVFPITDMFNSGVTNVTLSTT